MRKGIIDDGYMRIASRVLAQDDLTKSISEKGPVDLWKMIEKFRQEVSDAGLYYYPPAAASALRGLELSEGDSEDQYVMLEGTEKWGTNHIDMSNMEAIISELQGKAGSDLVRADGGEYAVRVFNPDGSLTAGGQVMQDVIAALASYPVLDDSDVSQREYDATIENIEREGYGVVSDDAPADWPKQVFTWLWDNEQDQVWGGEPDEDGGYWASEELIREAAQELGFAAVEDEEEEDDLTQSLIQKGGRRRAQEAVDTEEEQVEDPSTTPNWAAWQKAIQQETVKQPPAPTIQQLLRDPRFMGSRYAQAAPQLPAEEEQELSPEELEEVEDPSKKTKINWNDYIWGPFRKKMNRRLLAQFLQLYSDYFKAREAYADPSTPPNWSTWQKVIGLRHGQTAPSITEEGEELSPEEMEEVEDPSKPKINWNDLIWGPFRKKMSCRLLAQMSLQDEAIIRMVTEEDAQLVNFRGGYALVPLDGRAYPVDESGAELALAHGAEDRTKPKEYSKAGSFRRSAGPTGNEIIDSMARTLFVDAWARDWEYLWEDYERDDIEEAAASIDVEVPNFQGAELMDIAPPTEDEAYVEAQKIYDSIEQANPGVDLATFLPPGYTDEDYFDRDSFGHYLAMQAMGSGVRWSDSHPDHGLKIPYRENNVFTNETERVREALAQMQESELTMTTRERDE